MIRVSDEEAAIGGERDRAPEVVVGLHEVERSLTARLPDVGDFAIRIDDDETSAGRIRDPQAAIRSDVHEEPCPQP